MQGPSDMIPLAEYSVLTTSEYHLFQIHDSESGSVDVNGTTGDRRGSEDGVVSTYGDRMVEVIQAEETFKVLFELRAWRGPMTTGERDAVAAFPIHIRVPSKTLILNSVARGPQALWELPMRGAFNGRVSHVGREEARSLAEDLWEEMVEEDYSYEQERRLTRPHDGMEKYTIDLWPAGI